MPIGSKIGSGLIQRLGTLCLLAVTLGLCLLVVMAMEDTTDAKANAKDAQAKDNLHAIQLSIERFAVDSEGCYPEYLIGGSRDCATTIDPSARLPFNDTITVTNLATLPDPLIRVGYATSYPNNPFVKGDIQARLAVHKMQASNPSGPDPFCNGPDGMGLTLGTRFGWGCQLMGQVLADQRYPSIIYSKFEQKPGVVFDSHAGFGYPFWDIWQGDKPAVYLPGQFFYKSLGFLSSDQAAGSAEGPVTPAECTQYIMGVYGPETEKGVDIIGEETPLLGFVPKENGRGQRPDPARAMVWPWTRSATEPGKLGGSPYSSKPDGDIGGYPYGNPNGIRDGLILVLTASIDEFDTATE